MSFSNASFAHQFLDENWFVYLSRTFRGIDILSILWKCIHYYDCKAHQWVSSHLWVYRTALNMLTVKLLSSCSWYLIHEISNISTFEPNALHIYSWNISFPKGYQIHHYLVCNWSIPSVSCICLTNCKLHCYFCRCERSACKLKQPASEKKQSINRVSISAFPC